MQYVPEFAGPRWESIIYYIFPRSVSRHLRAFGEKRRQAVQPLKAADQKCETGSEERLHRKSLSDP